MIFRYRAIIPDSKIFFRVYEVKSGMTLFQFNSFILNDLDFSKDQMVVFEGYDAKGNLTSEYGLFDLGDGTMDSVTFSDLVSKEENEIHYVYDLHTDRYISLIFEGEVEKTPWTDYPVLVDGKGHNPDQFSAKYIDDDVPQPIKSNTAVINDDDEDLDDLDDDDDNDDEDGDGEGEEIYDENEFADEK